MNDAQTRSTETDHDAGVRDLRRALGNETESRKREMSVMEILRI